MHVLLFIATSWGILVMGFHQFQDNSPLIQAKDKVRESPSNLNNYYIPQSPQPYGSWNCYEEQRRNPQVMCLPNTFQQSLQLIPQENPLYDSLLLSTSLGLNQKIPGFNHKDHLPLNPYLALLLSHYGKYTPIFGTGRGLYGYAAANNYHNNKPFGAYKLNDDS